jgi:hypothetical protein
MQGRDEAALPDARELEEKNASEGQRNLRGKIEAVMLRWRRF